MCITCVVHMYLIHTKYTCIATHIIHLKLHIFITGVAQLAMYCQAKKRTLHTVRLKDIPYYQTERAMYIVQLNGLV